MKQQKEAKLSYWAVHLTTIVSVTLVLLIIGVIAMITIAASSESRRIREQVELSAVMADSVSDARAMKLYETIKQQSYTSEATFINREQALANWQQQTGENLQELFGANPLSPEISFKVKADYATPDAINAIRQQLEKVPGVEGVAAPDAGMVEGMNRNIERLTWLLGAIAIIMIVISCVLINNTVHLTVYSRRFTIHTMQLVGATNSFIRRPFVLNNFLCGVIATVLAGALLAGALFSANKGGFNIIDGTLSWPVFFIVLAGLLVIATLICSLSASIATSRYLRKDYDSLFH